MLFRHGAKAKIVFFLGFAFFAAHSLLKFSNNGRIPEPTNLIVHYVLYHKSRTAGSYKSVTFLECLSVLSVLKKLAPSRILVHTNVPEFWPFSTCNAYIKDWSTVKLVNSRLKRYINGKEIPLLHHEADIRKLEILSEYGGLVLDFDVYIINGDRLRPLLDQFPCVVCKDMGPRLSGGFIGCKRGAEYPEVVLQKSYRTGYKPHEYLWNFQDQPYLLHRDNPDMAHVLTGICDTPKVNFLNTRSQYNWTDKIALHAYVHNASFTEDTLDELNSSLSDLLKWILSSN